jgi:hypothetical protein
VEEAEGRRGALSERNNDLLAQLNAAEAGLLHSLPGVRVLAWTAPAVISSMCFEDHCKIT